MIATLLLLIYYFTIKFGGLVYFIMDCFIFITPLFYIYYLDYFQLLLFIHLFYLFECIILTNRLFYELRLFYLKRSGIITPLR